MEELKDPLGDRPVKTAPRPPQRPMPIDKMIYDFSSLPSWELIRDHLKNQGTLHKTSAIYLISQAKFIFQTEKNLFHLTDPITIVGDIHGQYYDLLKILETGGNPKTTSYLFLGDYVDRGIFSIEVLFLLYALKINYPKTIHLLRGNHETRQLTSFFNFRQETLYKYDLEVYEMIMESFDCMPLACIVNKRFLCLHGGISPDLSTLSDIENIERFSEPPRKGLFCDILWADPVENNNGYLSEKFKANTVRSCSYFFGQQAAKTFLKKNGLTSIIRAHEAQLEGYKMHRWNGSSKFPIVITVFSAPNYCDTYNNKGAIIRFVDSTLNVQQYVHTQHPYHLPNFLDLFSWSIPFVIEKTLDIFQTILRKKIDKIVETNQEENKHELIQEIMKLSMIIYSGSKNKESQMVVVDSPKNESISPKRVVLGGKIALQTPSEIFDKIKNDDLINEVRPD